MATYPVLCGNGSCVFAPSVGDIAYFYSDVTVAGSVIVRGGVEVDSLETLMPVGTPALGGEALRFDTVTAATGANPIEQGGRIQFGGQCWTGAVTVFGAGMRVTPIIDTQVAGVPATYHFEIGDRTGVEKWRIDQDGYVTMQGTLDSRYLILVNPVASAVGLTYTTQTASDAGNLIRNPGYTQWTGQCWTGAVNVAAPFASMFGIIDTQAAGVPATYHLEIRDRLGQEYWRVNQVGTVRTLQFALGATHGATPAAEVPGYILRNDTIADGAAGGTVQVSSSRVMHGAARNTLAATSETHDWRDYVLPVSAAGATSSSTVWERSLNGAGYATQMTLSSVGVLSPTGGVYLPNAATAITGGNHTLQMMSGILTTGGSDTGYAFDIVTPGIGAAGGDFHTDWRNNNVAVMTLGLNTVAATVGGTLTIYRNAIGIAQGTTPANEFPGYVLTNATAATNAVKVQVSPSLVWHGTADNTAVGDVIETHDWRAYVLPVTVAGPTTSVFIIGWSYNGATYTQYMRVGSGSAGNIGLGYAAATTITGGGNISIGNNALPSTNNNYNVAIGTESMYGASTAAQSVAVGTLSQRNSNASYCASVGHKSLYQSGANSAALGYSAGYYETGANKVFIDTIDRTSEALGRTNSLIYGMTDALVANQTLALNASVSSPNSFTVDKTAVVALVAPSVTGPVSSDGLLLTNWNSGASGVQEFSPSLRLDGVGYTAAATYKRHTWRITNEPEHATNGYLYFDYYLDGVAVATPFMLRHDGRLYIKTLISYYDVYGYSGNISMGNGTGWGVANQSLFSGIYTAGLMSSLADGASSVAARIGPSASYATEGARLLVGMNATVEKFSIGKDGVFLQAYGSAGTLTSVAPVVRTLVTLCDVNSTYVVEWYAIIEDQVGDAAHNAAYFGQAVYDKVAADSLVRRWGTANPELYDTAGDFTCVDSTADGNSIIVTASTTLDAHTFNVKVFGVRVMKCGNASLVAGVAYPLAA